MATHNRVILAGLIAITLLLPSCTGNGDKAIPSPSPTASTCAEMQLTGVPSGMVLIERTMIMSGVRANYRDSTGKRELNLLSGVPGETTEGARATGDHARVRGRDVTLFRSDASDVWIVTWTEAPVDSPCSQYTVTGSGLSKDEFRDILAHIR